MVLPARFHVDLYDSTHVKKRKAFVILCVHEGII